MAAAGCDCKTLTWRFGPMSRACEECGHPSPYHFSHFNKSILNPIQRYGYVGEGPRLPYLLDAAAVLASSVALTSMAECCVAGYHGVVALQDVLHNVQLRRTKRERASDVKLPPLTINVVDSSLDKKERDFYTNCYMVRTVALLTRGENPRPRTQAWGICLINVLCESAGDTSGVRRLRQAGHPPAQLRAHLRAAVAPSAGRGPPVLGGARQPGWTGVHPVG
eukprot:scaffold3218_cov350-Prasinococcus_capsulatus_cf.AAC.4